MTATSTARPLPSHAAYEEMEALWASGSRGADIAAWCEEHGHVVPSRHQVNAHFRRNPPADAAPITGIHLGGETPRVTLDAKGGTAVSRVVTGANADSMSDADLLRGWKLDPAEWAIVDGSLTVNRWVQNAESDTWCYQYKARLTKAVDGVAALTIAPAVNVIYKTAKRLPVRTNTALAVAVVYMDAQVGFWQDEHGTWHGTHDEAAIDISNQITEHIEAEHGIDELVDVGDIGDLPAFSHHRSAAALLTVNALNKSNQRVGELLAVRSAIAPGARKRIVRGNHDQRVTNWLADHAPHLLGARGANGELLISMDLMTGASAAGWEIAGDSYPTSTVWLNHNTRVIHGTKAGKGSAAAYLTDPVNTLFGHTPWVQSSHRTFNLDSKGPRTYIAAGGGGLMRVDGHLPPGIYSGVSETGQPGKGNAPWQQALWVVSYDPAGELVPVCESVVIIDGWASFRGRVFRARCDADGNEVAEAA